MTEKDLSPAAPARPRAYLAPLVIAAAFVGSIYAARPLARRAVREVFNRQASFPWLHSLIRHPDAGSLDSYSARADLYVVRLALVSLLAGLAIWGAFNARRVIGVFRRYFDEKGSPIDLAVFRMVLFGALFLCAKPATIDLYAGLPHELLTPPVGFRAVLRLLPVEPALAGGADLVLRAACLLAFIGLFTRSAALIASLSAVYVLGVPQCFGQVDHYHNLVWFSFLLALSRCGDALSVDAVWRRYRGSPAVPETSVTYARPIRWIWLLMGVIYFFPGFWKLWISGDAWFFGDALVSHMRMKWLELRWIPAVRLDHIPWLARAAGLTAVAFELSFIPLVLHRRSRPIAAVAGLVFHNLSELLMGISFVWLQAMYVSFLPVGRWVSRFLHRRPASARPPDSSARQTHLLDLSGGLLLTGNVIMGMLMIEQGWPIACFPTFARMGRPQATVLEFSAVSASGEITPIDAWPLIQALGTERWMPMVRRARREASVSALARWVASHTPEARNAAAIAVYHVTWSSDPDRRVHGPLSRELVAMVPR